MKGGGNREFAELIIAGMHPADVARGLEEANQRFLTSFSEFLIETVASCQKEVLAAKVLPLACYGRDQSALHSSHLSSPLLLTLLRCLLLPTAASRVPSTLSRRSSPAPLRSC